MTAKKKRDEKTPAWQFVLQCLKKKKMEIAEIRKAFTEHGYTKTQVATAIREARDRLYVVVFNYKTFSYTNKPTLGELFTWLRSRRRSAYTSLKRADSAFNMAKRIPATQIPKKMAEEWKGLVSVMGQEIQLLQKNGAL